SRSYRKPTAESFLVSNRNIPFGLGVVTFTATWTQAVALVVGATFAYKGQWEFFWFMVTNVGTLIFLGMLAPRVQEVMPRGYTFPEVVERAFGPGVRSVFALTAIASLVYIVSLTLTALQQWTSQQLGIPSWQVAIIIGSFAFLWVAGRGLPAAVIGDAVKVALILMGVAGVIALHFHHTGSVSAQVVAPASSGSSFWGALWMIGVPLGVTFLGAILSTPEYPERTYAVDRRIIRYSCFTAAALFAVIVIAYGSVGFLAKDLGLIIPGTQLVALEVLQSTVPQWAILVVTVVFIVLLTAGLASMLASAGDLMVIEVYRRFVNPEATNKEIVRWSRVFILVTVVMGTFIAALNLDLSLLVQSMAVIRGEVVIPMLLALFWPLIAPGRYVFWGMITGVLGGIAITFGGPLWQNVFNQPTAQFLIANGRPLGALFAFFAPLGFCLLAVAKRQAGVLTRAIGRDA
ncbi:MAG: hypothetical protein WD897_00330, partial [Parcubacteria group bacterium]